MNDIFPRMKDSLVEGKKKKKWHVFASRLMLWVQHFIMQLGRDRGAVVNYFMWSKSASISGRVHATFKTVTLGIIATVIFCLRYIYI